MWKTSWIDSFLLLKERFVLIGLWQANYTAVMRVEAEEGLVWELWTAFEMKVKE